MWYEVEKMKKAKKNKTGIAGNITDRTGGEQLWNWKC